MNLVYPNIVPENNLRLPDAMTITHGPAPLLARFISGSRQGGPRRRARASGVRHDFDELLFAQPAGTSQAAAGIR